MPPPIPPGSLSKLKSEHPVENTWDPFNHWDSDDDIRGASGSRDLTVASSIRRIKNQESRQEPTSDPTWRPDTTSHTPPAHFLFQGPTVFRRSYWEKRIPEFRSNKPESRTLVLKQYLVSDLFGACQMEEFEPGHQDRVTVIHVNFDGSRVLTASIDHRIKVWDRNHMTYQKTLVDTWKAHDADIRDAKWFHTTTGQHIASIGNDLRCRIWSEDLSEQPNHGRRFKRVMQISSTAKIPFVSLDLKTFNSVESYLALIDRQGLLTVYEPTNPDSFAEWTQVDQWEVTMPAPGRGEETSFRVRFDPNHYPLTYVQNLPCDKKMLSVIVSAMNTVKIYRSIRSDNDEGNFVDPPRPVTFWESCQFDMHYNLVRDVQWASGNVRGHDLLATACKDGSVRIYELSVSRKNGLPNNNGENELARRQSHLNPSQPRSSLTTAIVGRQAAALDSAPSQFSQGIQPSNRVTTTRQGYNFPWKQELVLAAKLEVAHNDAWMVSWDPTGKVLMSGGADGVTKLWKKGIFQESWKLFADHALRTGNEMNAEDEDGNGDGDA